MNTPTPAPWTVSQALQHARAREVDRIDAQILLGAALQQSRAWLLAHGDDVLPQAEQTRFQAWLQRRASGEPVAYILGGKEFFGLSLTVSPDVLIPRPDTETLMDVAMLAFSRNEAFEAIDLGTGSGAILLALLAERPAAKGVGTDISSEALAVAKENAANLDLNDRAVFLRTEWAAGFGDASFDLVLSNPPYIPTDHIATLDPEVRDHDPHLALDGGPDGLQAYRDLAPEVKRILKPGGVFAVEIGWDQGPQVKALFEAAGFTDVKIIKDLGERDRVITNGPDPRTNPIPKD